MRTRFCVPYAVLALWLVVFFFFQAEDGIRDVAVTGVQTCALPISVDSAVHAAAAEQRGIRRVDDGVDRLLRDIALDSFDLRHGASYPSPVWVNRLEIGRASCRERV